MNKSKHVIVCGAGIGGMTTALALRRQGLSVTVLEQAPEIKEVGAGLQLGPNATHALFQLGIKDEIESLGPIAQELVRRRWDGHVLNRTVLGENAIRRYGAPYVQVHRADLLSTLLSAAVSESGQGDPVNISVNTRMTSVEGFDTGHPVVLTAGGEKYQADAVVGADGIKSPTRASIGCPHPVVDSGDMCFRTLIDGKSVADDPELAFLFEQQAGHFWFGPSRHVIAYPIRNGESINIVGIIPESTEVAQAGQKLSSSAQMAASYSGWDRRLTRLLSKPALVDVMLWSLKHQEPHDYWSRGNVALVGDACHAMLPYVSQGASQAIEDGVVLANELALSDTENIPAAINRYVRRRVPDAQRVQKAALASQYDYHLSDGPEQIARDRRLESESGEPSLTIDAIYKGSLKVAPA